MATINLECNSLSQIHSSVFLQAENSMTIRAYMGEVLIQVWRKLRNELFDKQVNVQKENLKKNFWGSCKLPQTHKKVQ